MAIKWRYIPDLATKGKNPQGTLDRINAEQSLDEVWSCVQEAMVSGEKCSTPNIA